MEIEQILAISSGGKRNDFWMRTVAQLRRSTNPLTFAQTPYVQLKLTPFATPPTLAPYFLPANLPRPATSPEHTTADDAIGINGQGHIFAFLQGKPVQLLIKDLSHDIFGDAVVAIGPVLLKLKL